MEAKKSSISGAIALIRCILRIEEQLYVEAKLAQTEKSLNDAKTVIAGKDASIQNLQTNVNELTTSLKIYQDKEASEKKAKIDALVEAAINDCKIDKADKSKWIEMAENHLSLVESILSTIPAREKISKEIAKDPANVQAAAEAAKTTEQKLAEQVAAVVGENFKFRKMQP